jgi:hypothetical protein
MGKLDASVALIAQEIRFASRALSGLLSGDGVAMLEHVSYDVHCGIALCR